MLPLARYRFHWRVSAPIHLPAYAGSMLRGAFGHALRRLACMTRQADCGACPLLRTCPYPGIFAPPPVEHSLQQTTPSHIVLRVLLKQEMRQPQEVGSQLL